MDNRAALLKYALELFAARGYDAVGVQEVAEAAGVTKPTLYHYYGSKQGLLRSLLDAYQEPFNQATRAAAQYQGDLPKTLTSLAQAYFEFARQNPIFYRMLLAMNFAPHSSEVYRLVASRSEEQQQMVEAVFSSAVREHGNMTGRHRLYTATYLGMLNTCIGLWLNGYLDLDEALVQSVVRQFQYGIYS